MSSAPRPPEPRWVSQIVGRSAPAKRAQCDRDLETFSPGPEHLVSDDLFAYAQAYHTGRSEGLSADEMKRIEAHLLSCDACMAVFVEIEDLDRS